MCMLVRQHGGGGVLPGGGGHRKITQNRPYKNKFAVENLKIEGHQQAVNSQKIQFIVVKSQTTGCMCDNFGGEMSSSGCGFWKMWP